MEVEDAAQWRGTVGRVVRARDRESPRPGRHEAAARGLFQSDGQGLHGASAGTPDNKPSASPTCLCF